MLADIDLRRRVVSKGAAIAVGGFGLYIIGVIWWSIIIHHVFDSWFSIFFLLIFPLPMTLLSVYLLYSAIKVWSTMASYKSVCSLSSATSVIMGMLIFSATARLIPNMYESPDMAWTQFDLPIIMMLAGLFYVAMKKCLQKWLCIEEEFNYYKHESSVKRYFGFLAFFLWLPLTEMARLLPRDPQRIYSAANEGLEMLIFFGSFPAAYLFYRIGVKLCLKKRPEPVGEIEKLVRAIEE